MSNTENNRRKVSRYQKDRRKTKKKITKEKYLDIKIKKK